VNAITYNRRDPLDLLPIRVAVVLSVLIHAALLLELPALRVPAPERPEPVGMPDRLTVRIAPPFDIPPAGAARPAPAPGRAAAPQARRRPPPPVAAVERPAAKPAPATVAAPRGDLMAYVEARRQARGAPAEPPAEAAAARPAEDENARASRIAAANLAPPRMASFGYDPEKSGGVFTIERLSFDYAEFTFIGWNKDINRRTKQLIEVRRGDARDIRVAVVRRIIATIREHEPEEFDWYSERLARSIRLSARARDNAGLEDFMMQEFFGRPRG
jgi:hypothetical protein